MPPAKVGFSNTENAQIVGGSLSAAYSSGREEAQRESAAMESTVVYAFLVVACAPLIGIWRAHAWAKKNQLVLRAEDEISEQEVAA
jgi:hypothetical protein